MFWAIVLSQARAMPGDETYTTFDDVMREHGAALQRVAACYVPPGAERRDVEQEIALAIWEALPRFDERSSLRTYVFRIAHNRAIDHLRRRRPGEGGDRLDELPDPGSSPEAQAIARQKLEALAVKVRGLPMGLRQPLVLALEGCSHAEISEIVGISVSNVAVRIHRAKAKLGVRS